MRWWSALTEGRLAGAAFDTFWEEPLPSSHPLTGFEQTTLSPHVGYVTDVSYRLYFHDVVEDLEAFFQGEPIRVLPVAVS
jgi:phosphoglycerate dehydrogenase-like enzyme